MNLYLLAQSDNNSYDTYDSCVVCSDTSHDAVRISPENYLWDDTKNCWRCPYGDNEMVDTNYGSWANHVDNISCELIGEAAPVMKEGIVLASFNAG